MSVLALVTPPFPVRVVQSSPQELDSPQQDVSVRELLLGAPERLKIEKWQLKVADLPSHFVLRLFWREVPAKNGDFNPEPLFFCKSCQTFFTLKRSKVYHSQIISLIFRICMSQCDAMDTLCVNKFLSLNVRFVFHHNEMDFKMAAVSWQNHIKSEI